MADGGRGEAATVDIREIADALRLTKRSAERRAVKEGWGFEEVADRGGRRRRYPTASLPAVVQEAVRQHRAIKAAEAIAKSPGFVAGKTLARKLGVAEAVDAAVEKRARESGTARAAARTGKAKQRIEAKLTLLAMLKEFAAARGLGICASMDAFCEAFAVGDLQVPVQVRQLVGPDLHPSTIRRWRRALKERGADALAGDYGNRKGSSVIESNQEMRELVIALIADKPHISAKMLLDALDARLGDRLEMPSQRAVQRFVSRWKSENAEAFLALTNPDAWKNQRMAAFGRMDENITRINQLWMLDSSPADLQLVDGRHSLVQVIDIATRRIAMRVTPTSTAEAVCQVLRRGILEWGVPEAVKVDNGRDYASRRVGLALNSLHIEAKFSAPFSPWEKAQVERGFRTFSHSLLELLPGYTGHNVAEAQAIRARESFADRLFKKNDVIEVRLTADELQLFCDRWCRDYYAHEAHAGLNGATPFERAAQLRGTVTVIDDVRALDLLLEEGEVRTVGKKGLRLDRLTYIAPELSSVIGEQVLVRRDDDLGRVLVYHQERFLCVAECPEVANVSRREIAIEAKARQAAAVQQKKRELKALSKKANTRELAWEILDRKAQLNASLVELPQPNVVHLTPALEAAKEAVEARDATPDPHEWEITEAHVLQAAEMVREEQREDDTAETRFRRALSVLMKAPADRNDIEAHWCASYQRSPEFRGRWDMFEDFGAALMGLPAEFDRLRDTNHTTAEGDN